MRSFTLLSFRAEAEESLETITHFPYAGNLSR